MCIIENSYIDVFKNKNNLGADSRMLTKLNNFNTTRQVTIYMNHQCYILSNGAEQYTHAQSNNALQKQNMTNKWSV